MSLNVLMLQPSLPAYRVPVFRELASRAGIDLRVCYSQVPDLPNAQPQGFRASRADHRDLLRTKYSLVWQAPPRDLFRPEWCDCVVLNWNLRYLSLLPTILKAKAMQIPVVLWGHGFSKNESMLRRWVRTQTARLSDAIVTYNHAAAESLIAGGLSRQCVFVALNSLDQRPIRDARAQCEADPARLAAFRRDQRLDKGPVLLFCSRLYESNRVDLLISAARALRERHADLTVAIIGSGPDEARLRTLAAQAGVQDVVRFIGPRYDEAQLAPWFLSAQAFVYPANIGLSLLHSLGYGLPVITSDRADLHNPEIEALVPGHNGLTFRHGSAQSLASTIDTLLGDDALRRRLADNASNLRRFTLSRMVDGLESAIRYATRPRGALQATPAFAMA